MMMSQRQQLIAIYDTHNRFLILLLLFASFRLLTLVAYRPGGLILDFSDFYWYREFAQLDRQGYVPYQNLWTTYPPLFPLLMIGVWKISTLLPPWESTNLWFTLLLGGIFLLFEIGNFILLYCITLKLASYDQALQSAWIYAGLFVPVYTLTGWFESYPLFFFLLSLYLLLQKRPYISALCSGFGFMIKLIPLILLPVGLQIVPRHGRWGRLRIPRFNLDFDWQGTVIYTAIFLATVIAIAIPFYQRNPSLILAPFQITNARQPWETVWALLEGNYTYGVIPLDMRDLTWQSDNATASRLPWLWITGAFGLVYAFFYTRNLNWQRPIVIVAFTGLTVCLFFLYSKGYSPQWLGWLLIFSSILLPNLRGTLYAIILSLVNIVEANVFFIMLPEEHWLLIATVLLRTGLIIILALEFGFIIWPHLEMPWMIKLRKITLVIGLLLLLLSLYPAARRLGTAYFAMRLTQSPYSTTIQWLSEQPVTEAILLNDHHTYDWFYPYLRQSHNFFMLDDYADATTTVEAKTTALLAEIASQHQAIWIYDRDPVYTSPAEIVMRQWLTTAQLAHQADIDRGRIYLYIFKTDQSR